MTARKPRLAVVPDCPGCVERDARLAVMAREIAHLKDALGASLRREAGLSPRHPSKRAWRVP